MAIYRSCACLELNKLKRQESTKGRWVLWRHPRVIIAGVILMAGDCSLGLTGLKTPTLLVPLRQACFCVKDAASCTCDTVFLSCGRGLTSESPFIWVYNQTLPTKPNQANLSEWLFQTSEWLFLTSEWLFLTSEWLFLTSECLFLMSECLFLTSECLFLTSESLFLTSECLFLMSESPFIWVYNQTLPT